MLQSVLCSSPTIQRHLRLPISGSAQSSTFYRSSRSIHHIRLPISAHAQSPIFLGSSSPILGLQSCRMRISSATPTSFFNTSRFTDGKHGFLFRVGIGEVEGRKVEEKRHSDEELDEEDKEFRGESNSPLRQVIRNVNYKRDPPPLWVWILGLSVLVYAWRMVLWELGNWSKTIVNTIRFVVAAIDYFLGDFISIALDSVRSCYSSIVSSAPVPELTTIVILASAILAISESASPDSINRQPYLLMVASLVGYLAVQGFISELNFWYILFSLFGFAKFIKKRDYVASTMPAATVLASVGQPWVRVLVISSFTVLAIWHHWKKVLEGKEKESLGASESSLRRIPLPLMAISLAIGMRLAAQWAGYQYLTWKIA